MKKNIICLIILISVIIVNYCCTFYYDFIWDDIPDIVNNQRIQGFTIEHVHNILLKKDPVGGFYRPVTHIAFLLQFSLWKLRPEYYHIWNVTLYAINVVLIYFFILLLKKDYKLAFTVSVLFSVHPIHSEVVAWIAGCGYLYSMAFLISSIMCFHKYLGDRKKILFYFLHIIFYILSVLSRENSVALLPLFIIYHFCFINNLNLKNLIKDVKLYIPITFITIFFIYLFKTITQRLSSQFAGGNRISAFLMDLHLFLLYIKNLIYPINLNPMYSLGALNLYELFISFTLLILVGILLVIFWKKEKFIFYFIMWFFISLIPVTHFIIPVNFLAADRYIYFSSLSFCVFTGSILTGIYRKEKRIFKILSAGILIFIITIYSTLTISQNRIWKNDLTLWTYCIGLGDEYKNNPIILYNLGKAYYTSGDPGKAIEYFEEGIKHSKKVEYKMRIDLGIAYTEIKNYEKAIFNFEEAKKIEADNFLAYKNLGVLYYQAGLYKQSIEEFKKSLKLNPNQEDVKNFINAIK